MTLSSFTNPAYARQPLRIPPTYATIGAQHCYVCKGAGFAGLIQIVRNSHAVQSAALLLVVTASAVCVCVSGRTHAQVRLCKLAWRDPMNLIPTPVSKSRHTLAIYTVTFGLAVGHPFGHAADRRCDSHLVVAKMGNAWGCLPWHEKNDIGSFLGKRLKCIPLHPFGPDSTDLLGFFVMNGDGFESFEAHFTADRLDDANKLDLKTNADGSLDTHDLRFPGGTFKHSIALSKEVGVRLFGGVHADYETSKFLSLAVEGDMIIRSVRTTGSVPAGSAIINGLNNKAVPEGWRHLKALYVATALVECDAIALYATATQELDGGFQLVGGDLVPRDGLEASVRTQVAAKSIVHFPDKKVLVGFRGIRFSIKDGKLRGPKVMMNGARRVDDGAAAAVNPDAYEEDEDAFAQLWFEGTKDEDIDAMSEEDLDTYERCVVNASSQ